MHFLWPKPFNYQYTGRFFPLFAYLCNPFGYLLINHLQGTIEPT